MSHIPDGWPVTGENHSLLAYWQHRGERGLMYLEVHLGGGGPGDWPNRRSHRALDALYLPDHPDSAIRHWTPDVGLAAAVDGQVCEIVEAKNHLNVDVIGQCIAGVDMFSRSYPNHGRIDMVAAVEGTPDPALTWVCRRRGIRLFAR